MLVMKMAKKVEKSDAPKKDKDKLQKKKKNKTKRVSKISETMNKTINLYEALFFGVAILLLIFILLIKYVTPNI